MTTSSKSFAVDADTKAYVDYAVGVAIAKGQAAIQVGGNHAWSTNTGAVAVGTAGTTFGTELAGVGIVSKGSGKFRVIAQANFTNSAAATHNITPNLSIGAVSGVTFSFPPVSQVLFSGAAASLISGGGINGQVAYVYEIPATTATNFAGRTITMQLNGVADATTAISVAVNGATLDVQELL